MGESAKAVMSLRRDLPWIPEKPEVDEDGEEFYRGFNGDCSETPLYVTDGHILLLASAIDPAITIVRDEESWLRKHATESAIGKVWKPAEERSDVSADYIGWCDCNERNVAFLRDVRGRVIVVNAYLLAFGVSAVHPDALGVSAEPFNDFLKDAVALRRAGNLVGLLMPMKLGAHDFVDHDMHGDPVNLAVAEREMRDPCNLEGRPA